MQYTRNSIGCFFFGLCLKTLPDLTRSQPSVRNVNFRSTLKKKLKKMLLLAIESRPNDLRSGNRKKKYMVHQQNKTWGRRNLESKISDLAKNWGGGEREREEEEEGGRATSPGTCDSPNKLFSHRRDLLLSNAPPTPPPTLSLADWRIYGTHWKTGAGSAGAHGGRFEK